MARNQTFRVWKCSQVIRGDGLVATGMLRTMRPAVTTHLITVTGTVEWILEGVENYDFFGGDTRFNSSPFPIGRPGTTTSAYNMMNVQRLGGRLRKIENWSDGFTFDDYVPVPAGLLQNMSRPFGEFDTSFFCGASAAYNGKSNVTHMEFMEQSVTCLPPFRYERSEHREGPPGSGVFGTCSILIEVTSGTMLVDCFSDFSPGVNCGAAGILEYDVEGFFSSRVDIRALDAVADPVGGKRAIVLFGALFGPSGAAPGAATDVSDYMKVVSIPHAGTYDWPQQTTYRRIQYDMAIGGGSPPIVDPIVSGVTELKSEKPVRSDLSVCSITMVPEDVAELPLTYRLADHIRSLNDPSMKRLSTIQFPPDAAVTDLVVADMKLSQIGPGATDRYQTSNYSGNVVGTNRFRPTSSKTVAGVASGDGFVQLTHQITGGVRPQPYRYAYLPINSSGPLNLLVVLHPASFGAGGDIEKGYYVRTQGGPEVLEIDLCRPDLVDGLVPYGEVLSEYNAAAAEGVLFVNSNSRIGGLNSVVQVDFRWNGIPTDWLEIGTWVSTSGSITPVVVLTDVLHFEVKREAKMRQVGPLHDGLDADLHSTFGHVDGKDAFRTQSFVTGVNSRTYFEILDSSIGGVGTSNLYEHLQAQKCVQTMYGLPITLPEWGGDANVKPQMKKSQFGAVKPRVSNPAFNVSFLSQQHIGTWDRNYNRYPEVDLLAGGKLYATIGSSTSWAFLGCGEGGLFSPSSGFIRRAAFLCGSITEATDFEADVQTVRVSPADDYPTNMPTGWGHRGFKRDRIVGAAADQEHFFLADTSHKQFRRFDTYGGVYWIGSSIPDPLFKVHAAVRHSDSMVIESVAQCRDGILSCNVYDVHGYKASYTILTGLAGLANAQVLVGPDNAFRIFYEVAGVVWRIETSTHGETWRDPELIMTGTNPAVTASSNGSEFCAVHNGTVWRCWRKLYGENAFTEHGTICALPAGQAGLIIDETQGKQLLFTLRDQNSITFNCRRFASGNVGDSWREVTI